MSDIVLPLYSIISQCHAFNTKMFYVSKVLNDRVLRNIIDGGGGVWARRGVPIWNDTWGYICVSTILCAYLHRIIVFYPCPYPYPPYLIFPYPNLRDLVVSKMETTAIFYLDIDSKTSISITC